MTHVEDRIDPVADLEIIHSELRLKDIERVEGIIESFRKMVNRCAAAGGSCVTASSTASMLDRARSCDQSLACYILHNHRIAHFAA